MEVDGPSGMEGLSDDVLARILEYLDSASDLGRCMAVCRAWRDIALGGRLWWRLCVRMCPEVALIRGLEDAGGTQAWELGTTATVALPPPSLREALACPQGAAPTGSLEGEDQASLASHEGADSAGADSPGEDSLGGASKEHLGMETVQGGACQLAGEVAMSGGAEEEALPAQDEEAAAAKVRSELVAWRLLSRLCHSIEVARQFCPATATSPEALGFEGDQDEEEEGPLLETPRMEPLPLGGAGRMRLGRMARHPAAADLPLDMGWGGRGGLESRSAERRRRMGASELELPQQRRPGSGSGSGSRDGAPLGGEPSSASLGRGPRPFFPWHGGGATLPASSTSSPPDAAASPPAPASAPALAPRSAPTSPAGLLPASGAAAPPAPSPVRAAPRPAAKAMVVPVGCIQAAVEASSTDNYPLEGIEKTLEPQPTWPDPFTPSYWSSRGNLDTRAPEALVYQLRSPGCLVTEFAVRPFRAFFQLGNPIYSSRFVRLRLGRLVSGSPPQRPEEPWAWAGKGADEEGLPYSLRFGEQLGQGAEAAGGRGSTSSSRHEVRQRRREGNSVWTEAGQWGEGGGDGLMGIEMDEDTGMALPKSRSSSVALEGPRRYEWLYVSPSYPMNQDDSLQHFRLPRPVLCLGGFAQVDLLERVQTQSSDNQYYVCICHVQIRGMPLPSFGLRALSPSPPPEATFTVAGAQGEPKHRCCPQGCPNCSELLWYSSILEGGAGGRGRASQTGGPPRPSGSFSLTGRLPGLPGRGLAVEGGVMSSCPGSCCCCAVASSSPSGLRDAKVEFLLRERPHVCLPSPERIGRPRSHQVPPLFQYFWRHMARRAQQGDPLAEDEALAQAEAEAEAEAAGGSGPGDAPEGAGGVFPGALSLSSRGSRQGREEVGGSPGPSLGASDDGRAAVEGLREATNEGPQGSPLRWQSRFLSQAQARLVQLLRGTGRNQQQALLQHQQLEQLRVRVLPAEGRTQRDQRGPSSAAVWGDWPPATAAVEEDPYGPGMVLPGAGPATEAGSRRLLFANNESQGEGNAATLGHRQAPEYNAPGLAGNGVPSMVLGLLEATGVGMAPEMDHQEMSPGSARAPDELDGMESSGATLEGRGPGSSVTGAAGAGSTATTSFAPQGLHAEEDADRDEVFEDAMEDYK